MKRVCAAGALGASIVAGLAGQSQGQIAQGQLVVSGLVRPIWVTYAPGDTTGRLFVIEKQGFIRIVQNGTVNSTPFLDVDALTLGGTTTGSEQGLLGLAFHPNYQTNGLLYIYHITGAGNGTSTLAEYRVLGDPATSNVVDTNTRRTVLSFAQPFTNHNGGWIAFGPDGNLYITSGDGGSGNDPNANGQNINTLLGKVLRINVNAPFTPGLQYAIPAGNPFAGAGVEGSDEIWHYGLRNPWRSSFDRATGDLYIGDVGQGSWEEIDYVAAGVSGLNFGWRCMEGNHSTGLSGCTPFSPGLTIPIHEYPTSIGCAITGGYVYRGSLIPQLSGRYVFGDYCSGQIWTLPAGPQATPIASTPLFDMGDNLTSFGEDAAGELYYTDQNSGQLWKIVAVRCSAADLTAGAVPGQGGYGVPNGVLNNDDFFYYLAQFAAGNVAVADLTTGAIAGQPGYGVPNGIIDNEDFFYYLNLFSQGCPG